MSEDDIDQFYQFLKEVENVLKKEFKNDKDLKIGVSFIRKEPFQKFQIMKYFVEKFKQMQQIIGVVSSCVLINEEIQHWMDENDVYLTLQSIDGTQETHNQQRKFKSGQPTFEQQLRGVLILPERLRKYTQFRMTWTSKIKNLVEIVKFWNRLGVKGYQINIIPDQFDQNWNANDVYNSIMELVHQQLQDEIDFVFPLQWCTQFNKQTRSIQIQYKQNQILYPSCSVRKQISLFPEGNIFQCYTLLHPLWLIGNYKTNVYNKIIKQMVERLQYISQQYPFVYDWNNENILEKRKCFTCEQQHQCPSFGICMQSSISKDLSNLMGFYKIPETYCEFNRGFVRQQVQIEKYLLPKFEKLKRIIFFFQTNEQKEKFDVFFEV